MAPNRAQWTTFLIFMQIEIRRGKSYRSTCPGATYIEIARHGATNVVYARQISGQYRKIAAIQNRQEHLAGRRRQPFRSATLNTAKQGRSG